MLYDRFTDRARKVMAYARQEAQRFNHDYIGTEHILLGLIKEGSGVAANVLRNLDVDIKKIRLEVEKMVQSSPDVQTKGQPPFTPRAKKVIEFSLEEARALGHNYIGTEHILLGLLRENEGVAAHVLMNLGVKLEDVREEVLGLLGADAQAQSGREAEAPGEPAAADARSKTKSKTPALDSVRPRPDLPRARAEARPGHRPPEGDRARDDRPQPPHEEQPGAARRGRRRQDRHRRGTRPVHRQQQRAGAAARPADRRARPGADGRGHEVPRAVRGAHQGRAQRGAARAERHPLH